MNAAEALGWRFHKTRGHTWGELYCPFGAREGCIVRVYSTPKNREAHARHILRRVAACHHAGGQP